MTQLRQKKPPMEPSKRNVKCDFGLVCREKHNDDPTCVGTVWVSLLQHCCVALVHVFEHSVQCGVEKSCRAAALWPQSHQLGALCEARENWEETTQVYTLQNKSPLGCTVHLNNNKYSAAVRLLWRYIVNKQNKQPVGTHHQPQM